MKSSLKVFVQNTGNKNDLQSTILTMTMRFLVIANVTGVGSSSFRICGITCSAVGTSSSE